MKKRNLLLTLLVNVKQKTNLMIVPHFFFCYFKAFEIERLETFHNPLGRAELHFDQDTQSTYTNWKLYDLNSITNKAWQEYGRLAWFISPDLAISLYYTFVSIRVRFLSISNEYFQNSKRIIKTRNSTFG